MLACGEDLGLIPSCVHPVCVLCFPCSWFIQPLFTTCVEANAKFIITQVMQELGLVGLRIQRMPSESDVKFGIPANYDYMTVRYIFSEFYLSHL